MILLVASGYVNGYYITEGTTPVGGEKTSYYKITSKGKLQLAACTTSTYMDGEDWVTLDEYAFVDVNNDGVVEMIMRENLITDYLYAYVNGKVKFVGQMDHSANASGTYCNKKGIIYESAYRQSAYYYFNGKALKLRAEENNGSYYVNGKETTWEKFDAAVGELRKNASFRKNR